MTLAELCLDRAQQYLARELMCIGGLAIKTDSQHHRHNLDRGQSNLSVRKGNASSVV